MLALHMPEISKQPLKKSPISGILKIMMGHSFAANYQPVNFNSEPINEVTKKS